VQPRAKLNRPITVITYIVGTRTFTVCRKTTSCFSRTEHWHTIHATPLLTRTPMYQNSLNLKTGFSSLNLSCGLFSMDSIATDGVLPQNFRHWPAETHANWQLDSSKPEHIEPSDQSAAKKTEQRVCMLNFVWTNSLCRWSLMLLSL